MMVMPSYRADHDDEQASFIKAAARGDLAAVRRYFELPHVRENVAFWNTAPRGQLARQRQVTPPRPWYYDMRRGRPCLQPCVIDTCQVEVFRWFFEPAQAEIMGNTLSALANDLMHACLFTEHPSGLAMVEIFLESPVFHDVMTDEERINVLGKMLNTAVSRGYDQWANLLLAFGADPNRKCGYETPITAIAYQGNTRTLDLLLAHGARLEGEELLTQQAYDRVIGLVGDMLRRGADANAHLTKHGTALHDAASYRVGEITRLLINEGFADVDARDRDGRTPLMIAVAGSDNAGHRPGAPEITITKILVRAGANVNAVDNQQCSVLHHVARGYSVESMRRLLTCGANPNHRNAKGETPLLKLLKRTRGNVFGYVQEMSSLLLAAGADPLVTATNGTAVIQLLESTESGRAFLQEKQAFFHA